MKKVAFYIQIGSKDEIRFGNPLSGDSAANTFIYDLDNHSDQITLRYAELLLVEADEVVLVIQQHSEAAVGGLAGFFEKLVRSKKALAAYSVGKAMLPAGIVKKLDVKETTWRELGDIFPTIGK